MIDTQQHILRTPDHHYVFDGQTYPGVTGIVKVLDKSGPLMAWASRMTAEAAVALIDTLPQMLAETSAEGVVKALTSRGAGRRDGAAALGTEVHRIADIIVTGGEVPPMTPDVMTRVDHYLNWWNSSGWTVRASEGMVINPTVGYGGTLDLIAKDREGRTVLADIKTGSVQYSGRLYPEILMQLAAYGMGEHIEVDGRLFDMPSIDRYAVLHVTTDGVEEIEALVGDQEREAFARCLWLSTWLAALKGKRL